MANFTEELPQLITKTDFEIGVDINRPCCPNKTLKNLISLRGAYPVRQAHQCPAFLQEDPKSQKWRREIGRIRTGPRCQDGSTQTEKKS